MRALVTGDLGFLGRHFKRELYRRGFDVNGIDVKRGSPVWNDCRGFFYDSRGPEHRVDLAIHAAGVVGGREAIDGRPLDLTVNFELDLAYMRWLLETRPRYAVYFSSSAVYPVDLQDGYSDRSLAEKDLNVERGFYGPPDQIYGWTKLVGEELMRRVRDAGVNVTVVRPFSGYGEDQDLTYPFPTFIQRGLKVAGTDTPFEIWGPGTQVRDFVHVDDVVGATLAAVEHDVNVTNICTGIGTNFVGLAREVVRQVTGEDNPSYHFKVDKSKPMGVQHRVGDPTKMLSFYTPKITLKEGVRRALTAAHIQRGDTT